MQNNKIQHLCRILLQLFYQSTSEAYALRWLLFQNQVDTLFLALV